MSTLEAGVTTLTITFDRPEADNADVSRGTGVASAAVLCGPWLALGPLDQHWSLSAVVGKPGPVTGLHVLPASGFLTTQLHTSGDVPTDLLSTNPLMFRSFTMWRPRSTSLAARNLAPAPGVSTCPTALTALRCVGGAVPRALQQSRPYCAPLCQPGLCSTCACMAVNAAPQDELGKSLCSKQHQACSPPAQMHCSALTRRHFLPPPLCSPTRTAATRARSASPAASSRPASSASPPSGPTAGSAKTATRKRTWTRPASTPTFTWVRLIWFSSLMAAAPTLVPWVGRHLVPTWAGMQLPMLPCGTASLPELAELLYNALHTTPPALAGPVGSVEYVDLDDIAEDTFTAGPINSLPVQWWQTQPDAAKFASVELLRYLTGDSDGDNQLVCSGNVDEQAWQDVAYMSGNSQPLVLNVPTCPGSAHDLQRGRCACVGCA